MNGTFPIKHVAILMGGNLVILVLQETIVTRTTILLREHFGRDIQNSNDGLSMSFA